MTDVVTVNPWVALTQFTQARIALGRAGTSLPTRPHLDFQFAHARARNAVHHEFNHERVMSQLVDRKLDVISLISAAKTRPIYLQRPDLGRRLSDDSFEDLKIAKGEDSEFDISIVLVDGLSSFAVELNAIPFLDILLPKLAASGYSISPVAVVRQGRVAIGDPICESLKAKLVIVLIGERPGLSSPDSLGCYITWMPSNKSNDADRNCISNIRHGGIDFPGAAHKLMYLIDQAFERKLSGVNLKDETELKPLALGGGGRNFLLE